jgi:hypothetical protein
MPAHLTHEFAVEHARRASVATPAEAPRVKWIQGIAGVLWLACVCACSPIEVRVQTPDAAVEEDAPPPAEDRPFSFFVTSLAALRALSGSDLGFGGDLRFGFAGEGAGTRGADALCAAIAASSLPEAAALPWRAFLSTSREDAIDRIGEGPWYDRRGRLVAHTPSELVGTRPSADPAIADDLPNERGVPNSDPEGYGIVDNHDVLTGSDAAGRYVEGGTCEDWTSAKPAGRPRVGHAWPRSQSRGDFRSFISAHDAPGCAPGGSLEQRAQDVAGTVGGGGGYGAFYCFALLGAR